jgi:hypothetical protein
MKSIILILALIGIILLSTGYVKSNLQCPPPKIEYRYIPKTFDDEQNVHTPILSMAGNYAMFEDDSPWIENQSWATTNVKYKND